ncbi:hypothetical protein GCM10025777_19700 [Membranihabitans marinus]
MIIKGIEEEYKSHFEMRGEIEGWNWEGENIISYLKDKQLFNYSNENLLSHGR